MAVTAFVAVVLLFKHLKAALAPHPTKDRNCFDLTLHVSATEQNAEYDIVHVNNNINAVAFAVDIDTWTSPGGLERVIKNITVSDTFIINAQLCVPTNGNKRKSLQIATHGSVFDSSYWDVRINPSEYSYVDAVLEAGYSILTYDRLGAGNSDLPDAYTVVQAPLEVEILHGVTQMARNGDLLSHLNSDGQQNGAAVNNTDATFDKIIHVGHSFGSFLTLAHLYAYGNLSDAAVITGAIPTGNFSDSKQVASFQPQFAPLNDPKLFGDRPSGYVVSGTIEGV